MRSTLRSLGISAVMAATAVAAIGLPAHAETTTGTISGRIDGASTGWITAYDTSYTWITGTSINPDGSYQVELPPGGYKLEVWSDGVTQWMHQKLDFNAADTFTVTAGSTLTVNETLLPTGLLVGTLLDGTTPVAGAVVSAQPTSEGARPNSGFTNQEGRFSVRLMPGTYTVGFNLGSGLTQYYRQQGDSNLAQPVSILAGQSTQITETLLPTGSASGRLVEDGVGVAGAQVYWTGQSGYTMVTATTDADGRYRIPQLFAGEYRVSFVLSDLRSQWAHGKISEEAADRFTIVAGAETVVDETVLPTGQVRVHAVDAKTGQPITGFCASIGGQYACADGQVATFAKVPAGRHTVTISPYGDYLQGARAEVDVVANSTTDVTVAVQPAGIITTVVRDRRTGQPVANVCVHATQLRLASLARGSRACSDDQGRVRISNLTADTYTLFAFVNDGVHGMQWVGAEGGTGSQFDARQIKVDGGQTVDVPPVLLDPAGSVSGRVTDKATGKPVRQAVVSLLTEHSNYGYHEPSVETDADGRYTFANLGPYDWPLHFGHPQYAAQWSGGLPSRLIAKTVKIVPGKTVASGAANAALTTGTLVRGTARQASGAAMSTGFASAYEAATGDFVATRYLSDGTYEMRLLGATLVRFHVTDGVRVDGWHREAAGFADAEAVFIPSTGTISVDLVVR